MHVACKKFEASLKGDNNSAGSYSRYHLSRTVPCRSRTVPQYAPFRAVAAVAEPCHSRTSPQDVTGRTPRSKAPPHGQHRKWTWKQTGPLASSPAKPPPTITTFCPSEAGGDAAARMTSTLRRGGFGKRDGVHGAPRKVARRWPLRNAIALDDGYNGRP